MQCNAKPIEETDPLFASLIYDIANKEYKYGYKAMVQTDQGIYLVPIKIGRNDPCHCGSGKKYKKCCGKS